VEVKSCSRFTVATVRCAERSVWDLRCFFAGLPILLALLTQWALALPCSLRHLASAFLRFCARVLPLEVVLTPVPASSWCSSGGQRALLVAQVSAGGSGILVSIAKLTEAGVASTLWAASIARTWTA